MEVKFEECDMLLNKESLKKLSEFSNIHLLLVESNKEKIESGWKRVKVKEKQILLLNYHPKAAILGHDMFYEERYRNSRIIGYCPLNFPKEYESISYIL